VFDYAVTLVREQHSDFGPALATEKLGERDELRVSRETSRSWMVDFGCRASSAGRFISRGCDASPMVNWYRSALVRGFISSTAKCLAN
jgi:hypothetical protein